MLDIKASESSIYEIASGAAIKWKVLGKENVPLKDALSHENVEQWSVIYKNLLSQIPAIEIEYELDYLSILEPSSDRMKILWSIGGVSGEDGYCVTETPEIPYILYKILHKYLDLPSEYKVEGDESLKQYYSGIFDPMEYLMALAILVKARGISFLVKENTKRDDLLRIVLSNDKMRKAVANMNETDNAQESPLGFNNGFTLDESGNITMPTPVCESLYIAWADGILNRV